MILRSGVHVESDVWRISSNPVYFLTSAHQGNHCERKGMLCQIVGFGMLQNFSNLTVTPRLWEIPVPKSSREILSAYNLPLRTSWSPASLSGVWTPRSLNVRTYNWPHLYFFPLHTTHPQYEALLHLQGPPDRWGPHPRQQQPLHAPAIQAGGTGASGALGSATASSLRLWGSSTACTHRPTLPVPCQEL